MSDLLSQRRQWFSFFPEGTLEFLVVTRVLALTLLGTLMIVPSNQRGVVLVAIAAVLWLDYALLLWWLVNLWRDLRDVFDVRPSQPASRGTLQDGLLLLAPSVFAVLAVAPWPPIVLGRAFAGGRLGAVLPWAMALFYAASFPLAIRALRRFALPPGAWTALLLVPIVHWFAVHRLLGPLHARVRERALEQNLPVAQDAGPGAAAGAADVLLILGVIFWVLWGALLVRGRNSGALLALIQMASIAAGCLFAITQVAALEYLQRRFVALLRRTEPRSARPGATEELAG